MFADSIAFIVKEPYYSRLKDLKTWAVTGIGFAMDSYDIFSIASALILMDIIDDADVTKYSSPVATVLLAGSIFGSLIMGFLSDKMGRRGGMLFSMMMIIMGVVGSALTFNLPILGLNQYQILCIFRFFLGFGIGGEYPTSATYAAENAAAYGKRGRLVTATFSAQGIGSLIAASVGYFAYRVMSPGSAWRFTLGISAVPCVLVFYFRLKIAETDQFLAVQQQQQQQQQPQQHTDLDYAPLLDNVYSGEEVEPAPIKLKLREHLKIMRKHARNLTGTTISWFLLDIVFYFNGLFGLFVLVAAGVTDVGDVLRFNIYLALIAFPGYICAIFIIDKIGARRVQILGFLLLAVVYLVLGLEYKNISDKPHVFLVLYGITFFVSNCGPNTTTFVIPSLLFEAKVRSTCHGVSAASGRVGAVIGAAVLNWVLIRYGVSIVLICCSCVAFLGSIVTLVVIVEHLPPKLVWSTQQIN